MNRSDSVIRNRLADKALDNSELLVPYINEDDRDRIAALAMEMTNWAKDHPKYIAAYNVIEDLKNAAIEQFIGDNEAAEMLEWITEMKEAEDDAKREEQWVGYESARAA